LEIVRDVRMELLAVRRMNAPAFIIARRVAASIARRTFGESKNIIPGFIETICVAAPFTISGVARR
jgi:hypothetical protein